MNALRAGCPRRGGAFTLLEVILAVTLVVGLLATVLAFYRNAAAAYDRIIAQARFVASERAIMDRMTNDLRTGLIYQLFQSGMQGQSDQLQLMTASLPGATVWVERSGTEDPLPPEQDLQKVVYRLRVVEDEQGNPVIVGLERTCQKILSARVVEEGQNVAVVLLSDGIKFLNFRYYNGTEWLTSWGGSSLPQGVEITLGTQPLPPDVDPADYPFEKYQRVVSIPGAAQTSKSGAASQPGGGAL